MPVEIRKLVIKAIIDRTDPDAAPPSMEGGEASGYPDQDKLVADCVKQVLKILKREKQR